MSFPRKRESSKSASDQAKHLDARLREHDELVDPAGQQTRENGLSHEKSTLVSTTYLLHTALCQHPSDTGGGADAGASLTRNRMICSTSITDLEAWALSRGLSLRHCQDCAPADALGNYIADHSSEVMGREYGPPAERFHFYSRKAESFLRQAIGRRVWVIASTRKGSRTSYRLVGAFTAFTVRAEQDFVECPLPIHSNLVSQLFARRLTLGQLIVFDPTAVPFRPGRVCHLPHSRWRNNR